MSNVAILPTGRTEWEGLAPALKRLFPEHEFYSLPTRAEVDSNPERFPYDGFTSTALTEAMLITPPESACALVSRAAQEALGDRRSAPADLVIILDDVELPNLGQEALVVSVMRRAVETHLADLAARAGMGLLNRTKQVLRQKVSFHLIRPMIEGWFFADTNALRTAGLSSTTQYHFADTTDPEAFITDDVAYIAASEVDCPRLVTLPRWNQKNHRPKWLGSLPREQHPKGYLQWLCIAPNQKSCTCYSETSGGGRALASINWTSLLQMRSPTHFKFLRTLIEDLADGLDSAPLIPLENPLHYAATARGRATADAVLRNL